MDQRGTYQQGSLFLVGNGELPESSSRPGGPGIATDSGPVYRHASTSDHQPTLGQWIRTPRDSMEFETGTKDCPSSPHSESVDGVDDEKRKARRMQSNRESAKRSRERKTQHAHELEREVNTLKEENRVLVQQIIGLSSLNKDLVEENAALRRQPNNSAPTPQPQPQPQPQQPQPQEQPPPATLQPSPTTTLQQQRPPPPPQPPMPQQQQQQAGVGVSYAGGGQPGFYRAQQQQQEVLMFQMLQQQRLQSGLQAGAHIKSDPEGEGMRWGGQDMHGLPPGPMPGPMPTGLHLPGGGQQMQHHHPGLMGRAGERAGEQHQAYEAYVDLLAAQPQQGQPR